MRLILIPLSLLCLVAPASGQQTVPIDILGLYDRIPPPPTNVQEAYERAGCTLEGGCAADKAYRHIAQELAEVAQGLDMALAAASRPPGDPLQGMSPAELQQKLQSMSQEEQIRYAMELSQRQATAANAARRSEPPAVQAALAEARKIQEQVGQDAINGGAYFTDIVARLQAERQRQRAEAEPLLKAPNLKDAQGLPTDAYWQAQADAQIVYIAAEQQYEQALAVAMREEITRLKARFGAFQQSLVAIRYGADAVNGSTRSTLLGIQQRMLRAARPLMDASRLATAYGAELRKEQLEMQRNNT